MKKLLLLALMILPTMGLASDKKILTLSEKNSITFNSQFTGSYVASKQMEAFEKCAINVGQEITIVLYTPGGSVSAGQLFFDTLNALPCKFNTLTVFAASMGYQTVQNLGKRYILPSGILMSHRAYVSGLSGEIGGELDAILNLLKTNVEDLDKVAAKRVGLTLKQYQDLVRDELWLTADNAVKTNHADEIVLARCDETLSGSYFRRFDTFFGSFDVEFSNCPLVTGVISVARASLKEERYIRNYYNNLSQHIKMER